MKKLFSWLIVILLFPYPALAGQSILWFKSSPGDYIGQGREYFFSDGIDATITGEKWGNGYLFHMTNESYVPWPNSNWWYLMIEAAKGMSLSVGIYEDAMRSPFNDATHPGISLYGDGRGCNQSAGRFQVLEIERGEYDNIVKFAADFEQRCEITGPPLYGSIRFNSDIPISALLPAKIELSNPLNANKCVEASGPDGAIVTLNGVSSQTGTFSWSTSTGLTGSGPVFTIPVGMNSPTGITLTFSDSNGKSITTAKPICVSDTTPPVIRILSPVSGATVYNGNIKLAVEISDTVDKSISGYDVFVGKSFSGALVDGKGEIKVSKPDNGIAADTEITVTAQDASGNIGKASVLVIQQHDNLK
jgi:hypothetical protein